MEWYTALGFLLGLVLFFMFIGVPVALAFLAANMVGAAYFMGGNGDLLTQMSRGIGQLANNAIPTVTTFNLMPVPMFLLMGELFFFTGLANRMFGAIDKLMGRIPGRLSFVTVAGGTAFATLSGSSMGSTALLGSLMVPEMQKRGYKKHMAIGPILGTGGLAMLIPPSALAVLLATLANLDVGQLLIAGVVPGLILACFYAILILIMCLIDPDAAPAYEVERISWGKRAILFLTDVLPMMSIVIAVIILIMRGWATPSDTSSDVTGDVWNIADTGHVHGSTIHDATHCTDIFSTGTNAGLQPDLVWCHYTACAGNQFYHPAIRAFAVCDERGIGTGYNHA